jgi:hypothetical protein
MKLHDLNTFVQCLPIYVVPCFFEQRDKGMRGWVSGWLECTPKFPRDKWTEKTKDIINTENFKNIKKFKNEDSIT